GGVLSRLIGPGNAAAASRPSIPAALAERPNLLLVMVDTLRADYLSCYGAPVATPKLCSLADGRGTRYQAFSHASWTKPATASLLTSLVPSSHGAMSKPAVLPEGVETVAEVLQERGYTTGGIVSNINLAESFGFDQGFDEYHYLGPDYLFGAEESSSKLILYQIGRSVFFKFRKGLRFGDFYQDSAVVNELAFDWLERHRDSRFFLFLHYMDPHDPYFAHPYDGQGIARVSNQHPDPELAAQMRELYQGEIGYLDANFGELLDRLESLGLSEDTLIVLTADHGEEFQDHGGWWHGLTLYDEQVRVPLLVRWPAGWKAEPDATDYLVRSIDVAPTLVVAAGAALPAGMQGVDLRRGKGGRSETDGMAFLEEDHEGNVLRGIRTLEWKLIEANPGNPRGLSSLELYAVGSDPDESDNLVEAQPAVARELGAHAQAQEQLAERNRAEGSGEAAQISAAEEEALRALGYVE
ncbi:MAG: sulfatase, partial [Myxococcota bacterium]